MRLKAQSQQTTINVHGDSMTGISLPGRLASEPAARLIPSLPPTALHKPRCISQGPRPVPPTRRGITVPHCHDCETLSFLPAGRGARDALPALCDLKLVLSLPITRSDQRIYRDFLIDSQSLLSFTTTQRYTDVQRSQRFDFSVQPAMYFELGSSQMHRYDNDKWFPNIMKALCKIEDRLSNLINERQIREVVAHCLNVLVGLEENPLFKLASADSDNLRAYNGLHFEQLSPASTVKVAPQKCCSFIHKVCGKLLDLVLVPWVDRVREECEFLLLAGCG